MCETKWTIVLVIYNKYFIRLYGWIVTLYRVEVGLNIEYRLVVVILATSEVQQHDLCNKFFISLAADLLENLLPQLPQSMLKHLLTMITGFLFAVYCLSLLF